MLKRITSAVIYFISSITFERPLGVISFLTQRIEAERAKLAGIRAAPGRQDRVECQVGDPDIVQFQVIVAPSQRSVRKGDRIDVAQGAIVVVDDRSVIPVGDAQDLLVWSIGNDPPDRLLPLAPDDDIDVRAPLEEIFEFFGLKDLLVWGLGLRMS